MRKYTPDTSTLSLLDGQVCKNCLLWKPLSDFDIHRQWSRERNNCRECCSQGVNKMCGDRNYRENRQKYLMRSRFRRYGITADEYLAIVHAQDHKCAICGKEETRVSRGKCTLSVDHDHTTGLIRGIICGRCNKCLGLLEDNPDLIDSLSAYLRKHYQK